MVVYRSPEARKLLLVENPGFTRCGVCKPSTTAQLPNLGEPLVSRHTRRMLCFFFANLTGTSLDAAAISKLWKRLREKSEEAKSREMNRQRSLVRRKRLADVGRSLAHALLLPVRLARNLWNAVIGHHVEVFNECQHILIRSVPGRL